MCKFPMLAMLRIISPRSTARSVRLATKRWQRSNGHTAPLASEGRVPALATATRIIPTLAATEDQHGRPSLAIICCGWALESHGWSNWSNCGSWPLDNNSCRLTVFGRIDLPLHLFHHLGNSSSGVIFGRSCRVCWKGRCWHIARDCRRRCWQGKLRRSEVQRRW